MLGINNSVISVWQHSSNAHTRFSLTSITHSLSTTQGKFTLLYSLLICRSLFLLMNQLITTFLQTSETAELTLLSNARGTEISDKVWFRNVTGSNLSQQFATGKRLKLLFKLKREGKQYYSLLQKKKRTNTLYCGMPANSPKPCLHRP